MKDLRIVLVDDSPSIQEFITRFLLRMKGCKLVGVAGDGEEALLMIRMLHPHVVLLDVSMPVKNGVEVLRELREENSEVMIIMFTADSSPRLRQACLTAGANYFVCKTDFQQLLDIIAELQHGHSQHHPR
ncbi:MAG TPA: response regulator transcription factor [Pyrinomonadaceae bacterium]|nr:response regulator transcription factor [Pyrinomonadaceae bacterium]